MTHDPREVPQITMADIRKHTGEGMVSEQSVIDAANEVLKEIYTSPPPAEVWDEAIEAAKLVVERLSLPTIQTPSMWLIDKAGIVAEIEALRRESPVPDREQQRDTTGVIAGEMATPSDPPDRREIVARIKADPGDGTLHPDLAHVLARGFDTMGWDRPASAAEDMIDAILAALDGGAGA